MLRVMKPGRRYFIINIDEPYAKAVYEILKFGQMAKVPVEWPEGDISFEEWKELTFVKQMPQMKNLRKKNQSEELYRL